MARFLPGATPRVFAALAALCVGHSLELSLSPDDLKTLERSKPCKTAGSPQQGGQAHGGSLLPGCMCPMGLRGFTGPGSVPGFGNQTTYVLAGLRPGEVEVVTVDVKTANWVRCNNVSVATSVAKLLKIPLKRVTVTPWSWTPEVPQVNYLAFVQEDHDRCDCDASDGRAEHGVGFRRVESSQAPASGAPLNSVPDTSVMTVAQFRALQAAQDASQIAAATPTPPPLVPPWGSIDPFAAPIPAPPRARVQMLTRDPCLVKLLRLYTSWFRQHLASVLQVPQDKLLLDPPPVEGTVGLLQLDSSLSSQEAADSSEKVGQVPVLAVHECSGAELHERMQQLHLDLGLLSERQPPNYVVVGNFTGAMPLNYSVLPPNPNASNVSNATNATTYPVTPQRVFLAMNLTNIDYDKFAESWSLIGAFDTIVKGAIGASGHVPSDAIKMALYPGSIGVEATITPPPNTAPAAILAFLNDTVCPETVGRLNAMVALSGVTTGGINCSQLELKLIDPPFPPEEKNRAWIAFWNVVILPPYAEEGSWRLLNEANDPKSEITKLFPLTLARVPGMKYRAIKDDNAANETRLPPPLDKALRFKLPNPINEEAALQAEIERMKNEEEKADFIIKDKQAAERMQIQRILEATEVTKRKIDEEAATVVRAAKAHVAALFNSSGAEAPVIVPWGVLTDRSPDATSPYPWQRQIPPPQVYSKVNLLSKKQKVLRR
mmetsp:Transcript_51032/g.79726  ORF Transcript_51032/g.79726 Transcript_51032/m.79726 type:complete len:717 (+) Transcript_51032:116-2266(+)